VKLTKDHKRLLRETGGLIVGGRLVTYKEPKPRVKPEAVKAADKETGHDPKL